jgi:hypothetical protein
MTRRRDAPAAPAPLVIRTPTEAYAAYGRGTAAGEAAADLTRKASRRGPPVVIGVESRPPNAQSLARAHQGTARFRRDKRLAAKLDSLLGAVDADDEGEA